jgi:alkanesulfonate monooxygenase SsuD/methylene tetrahydromethanopterin reductase-like flavin-dependent oxidoreductase (luciferase family)
MFVASDEFVEAARAQAKALGFSPAVQFVPHPIQDRSDEEIRRLADAAFEDILAKIVAL